MSFEIKIDTASLEKKLQDIANSTDEIAEEVVKNLGSIVKKVARKLVPVDSGDLKKSIDLELIGQGKEIIAEIGTPLDYGWIQEYGSSKQPAQSYLRPALEQAREQSQEVTKKVVRKYVNK